jgi:hypothetical protein
MQSVYEQSHIAAEDQDLINWMITHLVHVHSNNLVTDPKSSGFEKKEQKAFYFILAG